MTLGWINILIPGLWVLDNTGWGSAWLTSQHTCCYNINYTRRNRSWFGEVYYGKGKTETAGLLRRGEYRVGRETDRESEGQAERGGGERDGGEKPRQREHAAMGWVLYIWCTHTWWQQVMTSGC